MPRLIWLLFLLYGAMTVEAHAEATISRPPVWQGKLSPPGGTCPNESELIKNPKFTFICKYASIGTITNVQAFTPGLWEGKSDEDWEFLKKFWRSGGVVSERLYFEGEACGFGDNDNWARWDAKGNAEVAAKERADSFDQELKTGKFRPYLGYQHEDFHLDCRPLGQGGGEARTDDDEEPPSARQDREQVTPEPRRQKQSNRELIVEVTSLDRYAVELSFYSEDRSYAWPGNNKIFLLADSEPHTYRLSCRYPRQKICYGAWRRGNPKIYWGIGYNGQQGCSSCCMTCGGSYQYTLNPGPNSPPPSARNDAVNVLGGILSGLAAGMGAANAARGSRPAPAPAYRPPSSGQGSAMGLDRPQSTISGPSRR